jgi:hypothetical protein
MEYRFKPEEWKNLSLSQTARRCQLMAEQALTRAEGAAGDVRESYTRIARDWMQLADDLERATTSVQEWPPNPGRPRLNPADAKAIAEFLNGGGQIAKVKDPVTATEQEVIDFLAGCGVAARYLPGDVKAYWCNNRRCSMTALVRLANTHRYAQQLAPFALRLLPSPRKK